MTENLHALLVSTLTASGIRPALSEDEIEGYPYVTFELPTERRYDKDGCYKIVGDLTIRAVSDDFDQADQLRSEVEVSIAGGFPGPAYTARLTDVRKDCTDGIWVVEMDYVLNQNQQWQ